MSDPTPSHTSAAGPSGLASSPATSRKSSWLSTLSPRHRQTERKDVGTLADATTQAVSPHGSTGKTANVSPAFLITTLKRLKSSSHALSVGGRSSSPGSGATVPPAERKIMNKNLTRDNCAIKGIDGRKLRRVAFSLDIEYADASLSTDVTQKSIMKVRRSKRKLQASNSEGVMGPKSSSSSGAADRSARSRHDIKPSIDNLRSWDMNENNEHTPTVTKNGEEEATDDSQRKSSSGLVNKAELTTQIAESKGRKRGKHSECAKIYRRCCQLREVSPLKDISSQFSNVVGRHLTIMDLSLRHLSMADINCLSDFLAVVPVRILVLDECDLSDEGLRVILASLVSVRTLNYQASYSGNNENAAAARPQSDRGKIERVSMKRNCQIGEEGWRVLCCFIHMSRSLRSLDVSGVPFPTSLQVVRAANQTDVSVAEAFVNAIKHRLNGKPLDELNLSHCSIPSEYLKKLLRGITKSGIKSVGLAGNGISTEEQILVVARWLESGGKALDLSENNIGGRVSILLSAIKKGNCLFALGLRDCGLTPPILSDILQSLSTLPDLRFLDLSGNKSLSASASVSVSVLVKYLSKFPFLKRLHLDDLALEFSQVIALSEIIASSPRLAHISLRNDGLPSGTVPCYSEENRIALFTALITAVSASTTIVSVDIDLPDNDSGVFLQALALKLISLCLRNIERGAATAWMDVDVFNLRQVSSGYPAYVEEARAKLNTDGFDLADCDSIETYTNRFMDMDGSGIAQALEICLDSTKEENLDIEIVTLLKSLLIRAEAMREKLRPALCRATFEGNPNDSHYRKRLEFILKTIDSHIERFRAEFPGESSAQDNDSLDELAKVSSHGSEDFLPNNQQKFEIDDTEDDYDARQGTVSTIYKDIEAEEGQMHRIGHFISEGFKLINSDQNNIETELDFRQLKAEAETLEGSMIRRSILEEGPEKLISQIEEKP